MVISGLSLGERLEGGVTPEKKVLFTCGELPTVNRLCRKYIHLTKSHRFAKFTFGVSLVYDIMQSML